MSSLQNPLSQSGEKILQRSNNFTFRQTQQIIDYGRMKTGHFMVSNTKPRTDSQRRKSSILNQMKMNDSQTKMSTRQKVCELRANKEVSRLELVVLRRYPRRLVSSQNYSGSLAAACGRDETGIVGIVLWGDQVKEVNTGDIIRIENGWCRSRNGELVVSTGKSGKLTVIDR